MCAPAHYCPAGSSSPTQFDCTMGGFCPGANGAPIACPAGAVCAAASLTAFQSCPSGAYCNSTGLRYAVVGSDVEGIRATNHGQNNADHDSFSTHTIMKTKQSYPPTLAIYANRESLSYHTAKRSSFSDPCTDSQEKACQHFV